ncbi:preprotein translocase subunit SecG [Coxiella endosymbiont of Ornithodoros amblus]|uniref:preprotein translocase subunit SecG n=1 Tax=Coxiella endosymbiont of Ornithodoros amblus TaxID=1656166 RepID=UPI00244E14DD|nr:preprotein translocase subunit SecG [Coxiella endosymbiont of Ornithodoros amblus]MBW5802653.1 preprotein translocase subunit SecG [Coxiella endosymbiont of Ornithodoros amblus]
MQSVILIIHALIAVSLIALVLLQHGKGADTGAAFGSTSSNTMFGSVGATPFLMKVTIFLAAAFFVTSIGLSYLALWHLGTMTSPFSSTQTAPPSVPRS